MTEGIEVTKQVVVMTVTNANLEALREKYATVPDCSKKEGYEMARVGIAEIVGLRTKLAACKKDLKAEALAYSRTVDSEYNRILNVLVAIETPMKEAKKEVDAIKEAEKEKKRKAEETRKFQISEKINEIREIIFQYAGKSSEVIKAKLKEVEAIKIKKDDFQEFKSEAERARIDVEVKLQGFLKQAIENEEADKLRKEEEERLATERKKFEEDQAKEVAAREKRGEKEKKEREEREAAEAKKRKEEEDKFEEERESLRVAQAELDERERIEKERLEKEAEEKRLADEKEKNEKAAKKKVKEDKKLQEGKTQKTYEALFEIIDMKESRHAIVKRIIGAIKTGHIPNVTFN
ncbi:hypothetical protein KAR91_51125 [Candidatus Pacearchaeota archaeon]|nr:hypothetical protein [Candidatus Pacearchaeota archaeon]